jgi:hypothetical protein
MRKYKHDWYGTYFQMRCRKCGKFEYAGCGMCDSEGILTFIERLSVAKDCPVRDREDVKIEEIEKEVTRFDLIDFED